jgi:DNA polymerase V
MAQTVLHEMMDNLSLTLVEKSVVTNQIVLVVEYDIDNLKNPNILNSYKDKVVIDSYGRKKPKHARGTININHYTSSSVTLVNAVMRLYDDIVDKILTIRKINICANNIKISEPSKDYRNYKEHELYKKTRKQDNEGYVQLDIFEDYEKIERKIEQKKEQDEKIRKQQKAMLAIKNKYSKNALLKANSLTEGATLKSRNEQIGGHKA